jgi:hypothetical protein
MAPYETNYIKEFQNIIASASGCYEENNKPQVGSIIPNKKKSRLSRIQKQAMYGGRK